MMNNRFIVMNFIENIFKDMFLVEFNEKIDDKCLCLRDNMMYATLKMGVKEKVWSKLTMYLIGKGLRKHINVSIGNLKDDSGICKGEYIGMSVNPEQMNNEELLAKIKEYDLKRIEKDIEAGSNESDLVENIPTGIMYGLIMKDECNIEQSKHRYELLKWLDKTDYVNGIKYIPPFYREDYLRWLEGSDIWAIIPEYPRYEINSSTGDVRDIVTKKSVREVISAGGKSYFMLKNTTLYGDGFKMKSRAYLLAITFIPNNNVSIYNQVHYIKDKNVDKLTNLVWSNQAEATKKNFVKGMKKANRLTDKQKKEIINLVLSGAPYSYGKLSRKYSVHSFVISALIKDITYKCKERLKGVSNDLYENVKKNVA